MFLSKAQKDEIIEIFIEYLKKPKHLPYKIVTNRCPNKKKDCRLHHGEIVVTAYDKKTKKFHLKYFGTHEKGVAYQYDQPADFVMKIILRQLNSKKKLIRLTHLNKIIKFSKTVRRNRQINLKFTNTEWKKIVRKSSKKNVTPYQYCRDKLLT